ncbi:MAG: multi-sensor hybrid histidine kinase [Cyanobacteria bacterium RYN_339]|nr:multi-sensor hybrid histidine kinase [Cyanobacteria bacterium RYN_339]
MTTLDTNQASQDAKAVADYASYLRADRLDDVAAVNHVHILALGLPLMRLYEELSDAQVRDLTRDGIEKLLADLEQGTALATAHEGLRLWAADELPGLPKGTLQLGDMVRLVTAQKGALLNFLPDFTAEVPRAMAIVRGLEEHYRQVQDLAFQLFARLREDTARAETQAAESSEALARQKSLMERIIEQAPAGIAYLDRDMIIRWVNPEFTSLFDRPAEFFLGRRLFELADGESRDLYEARVNQVLVTGEPFKAAGIPYTLTYGDRPRQTFWDFNYAPVFGPDRQVEGLLVFALEVSNRVERETLANTQIAQLQQVDRMKDEFLNAMSYQLSTPIHTIMGFAGVLAEGAMGALRPEQEAYLRRILATCTVQMALVDDLLDNTRMSAGKFTVERRRYALADSLVAVLDALEPLAIQKGLRVIRHLPAGLQRPYADQGRVEQVFTNLVNAAIKLTPPGGMIRAQVSMDEREARIEVQDSGTALLEEDRNRVFERFTQHDGTWLGLSVSRTLVEAHGGKIGVKSAPGEGNTFWFTLPLNPPEPEA